MKKSLGASTLLFPTPVLLVGTYDANETPNLMTAAWGGICCSKPLHCGFLEKGHLFLCRD